MLVLSGAYVKRAVFYSWMADLPNATNRGLTEKALRAAVDAITANGTNDLELAIEQDARGESGSADIAASIFEKIDRCDVMVADVSIVPEHGSRQTPNPNVLIELGYGAARLGWNKVIMVFNEASGSFRDDRPFDIRNRNTIRYKAEEAGQTRSEERARLARALENALREALLGEESRAIREWTRELANPLFRLLIELDEFTERFGWDRPASLATEWSDAFRRLAAQPAAERLRVRSDLSALAELCEAFSVELKRRRPQENTRETLRSLGEKLKSQLFTAARGEVMPESEGRAELRRIAETTADLAGRADALLDSRGREYVYETASQLGERMLFLLHFSPSFLTASAENARRAARTIHLHVNGASRPLGDERARIEEIRGAAEAFRVLVE